MAFIINPRNLADSVSRPVRFVYCASVSLVYRGHETEGRLQSCLIGELLAWGLLKEPRPAWCDMAGETRAMRGAMVLFWTWAVYSQSWGCRHLFENLLLVLLP